MRVSVNVCHICDFVSKTARSCQQHCSVHIGVKPYFCNVCLETFLSEPIYHDHIFYTCKKNKKIKNIEKKLKKKYVCNICEMICSSWSELSKHYLDHLVQLNIKCNDCKLFFTDDKDYAIHQHLHQEDLTCKICHCAFQTKQEMLLHVVSHNPHKYFNRFKGIYNPQRISRKNIAQNYISLKKNSEILKKNSKLMKNSKISKNKSKTLKISPKLFGQKHLSNSAAASSLNTSNEYFNKISDENIKIPKTNAFSRNQTQIEIDENIVPVKDLHSSASNSNSTAVLSELLLGNSNTSPYEKSYKKTISQPYSKPFTDNKSPLVNAESHCKQDSKLTYSCLDESTNNSHFTSFEPGKPILTVKYLHKKYFTKYKFSSNNNLYSTNEISSIDEMAMSLKQCSVILKRLPFFVQDYESYELYLKSKHLIHSSFDNSIDVDMLKYVKQLKVYFHGNIRAQTLLKLVEKNHKNSISDRKILKIALYELCTIYYNTFLTSASNSNHMDCKYNSDILGKKLSTSVSDTEETLCSLKKRIQTIRKSLYRIDAIKKVKNLKCLKILLHRLPHDIFDKYLNNKPIMVNHI